MFLKIHRFPGSSDVVAVCDRELMNCTLREGKITVTIEPEFYGDKPATEAEVREALRRADNANLMGEWTVAIAIDMGLITKEGCIMIGKIPHAQIL